MFPVVCTNMQIESFVQSSITSPNGLKFVIMVSNHGLDFSLKHKMISPLLSDYMPKCNEYGPHSTGVSIFIIVSTTIVPSSLERLTEVFRYNRHFKKKI